jgi:hypothetical protein
MNSGKTLWHHIATMYAHFVAALPYTLRGTKLGLYGQVMGRIFLENLNSSTSQMGQK